MTEQRNFEPYFPLQSTIDVKGTPEAIAALFAGLDAARTKATAVRKSSESNLGKYAKSEHILVVARVAAQGTGITVSPLDSYLDPDGMILYRGYLVAHSGGAYFRGSMAWPVLGRPDVAKGTGSSETMAFAYFLRTLFWMPRMASDDMDNPRIQTAMRKSHNVTPVVPMDEAAGEEGRGLPEPATPEAADDAPAPADPAIDLSEPAPDVLPWGKKADE